MRRALPKESTRWPLHVITPEHQPLYDSQHLLQPDSIDALIVDGPHGNRRLAGISSLLVRAKGRRWTLVRLCGRRRKPA